MLRWSSSLDSLKKLDSSCRTCMYQTEWTQRIKRSQRKALVFLSLCVNLKPSSDSQKQLLEFIFRFKSRCSMYRKLIESSRSQLWMQLQVAWPLRALTLRLSWCQWSERLRRQSREEWLSAPRSHTLSSIKKWCRGSRTRKPLTTRSSAWSSVTSLFTWKPGRSLQERDDD